MTKQHTGTYLLKCEEFLKIGYTSVCVRSRIKAMQTGNPFTLAPLAIVPSPPELEVALHGMFKGQHYRGEWFVDDEEIHRYFAVNGDAEQSGWNLLCPTRPHGFLYPDVWHPPKW